MFTHAARYEGGLERADVRAVNAMLSDTPMRVLGGESALRILCGARAPSKHLH